MAYFLFKLENLLVFTERNILSFIRTFSVLYLHYLNSFLVFFLGFFSGFISLLNISWTMVGLTDLFLLIFRIMVVLLRYFLYCFLLLSYFLYCFLLIVCINLFYYFFTCFFFSFPIRPINIDHIDIILILEI